MEHYDGEFYTFRLFSPIEGEIYSLNSTEEGIHLTAYEMENYLFRELELNIDDPAFATFDFQGYGERQLGLLESVQTTYGMITRNEDFPIQTQQNTEQGMKMQ